MSMLIEINKVDLVDGEELMELARKVQAAITQHKGKLQKSLGLIGIYKDHIVVRDWEDGKLFRMDMKRDDKGEILLADMTPVKQAFIPVRQKAETVEKAEWSVAFINGLPDSSFLYVAPGGRKDAGGKTIPRTLRYFPVKDEKGKVDLPHLRNALARIPQANIPQAAKTKATAAAKKLLESANKTEKSAMGFQVVTLPELMVAVEDGKLDADSLAMIQAIAKSAVTSDTSEYIKVPSESMWRGIF